MSAIIESVYNFSSFRPHTLQCSTKKEYACRLQESKILLFLAKIRLIKLKERRHDNNLHIFTVCVVSGNVVTRGIWMKNISLNLIRCLEL